MSFRGSIVYLYMHKNIPLKVHFKHPYPVRTTDNRFGSLPPQFVRARDMHSSMYSNGIPFLDFYH